jgi:hypothetical protein
VPRSRAPVVGHDLAGVGHVTLQETRTAEQSRVPHPSRPRLCPQSGRDGHRRLKRGVGGLELEDFDDLLVGHQRREAVVIVNAGPSRRGTGL